MLIDEEASRFMHDQIGRRYIPIMGIGRGKADFDVAARDHCNPVEGMIALRLSPLINENQTHRIWTIKQEKDAGTENATEFRYRLKKQLNEGDPAYGDSDLLGIERSIKF